MPLQTRELVLTGAVVYLLSYVLLNTLNPPFVRSKKEDCQCAASTVKTLGYSAVPFVVFVLIYHYIYLKLEKQE